jgi:ribosomal RNA-processing protein 12
MNQSFNEKTNLKSKPIQNIINEISNGISVKNSNNIEQIFSLLATLIKLVGNRLPLNDILSQIDKVYSTAEEIKIKHSIEECFGASIKILGPEKFLDILPLNLTEKTENRKFLLPILKNYVSYSDLKYFTDKLLPLAREMKKKSLEFEEEEMHVDSKQYKYLHDQIWMLLSNFLIYPKNISKISLIFEEMFEIMINDKSLIVVVCNSINKLITVSKDYLIENNKIQTFEMKSKNEEEFDAKKAIQLLNSQSKTLFPLLFNLYGENESVKDIILNTIGLYSSISDETTINGYFKMIIKKFLQLIQSTDNKEIDEKEMNKKKYEYFDISISMINYLPEESVEILYKVIKDLINQKEDRKLQKNSYKALFILLELKSKLILKEIDEIIKLFNDSLGNCFSKKYRLKILLVLIEKYEFKVYEKYFNRYLGFFLINKKKGISKKINKKR